MTFKEIRANDYIYRLDTDTPSPKITRLLVFEATISKNNYYIHIKAGMKGNKTLTYTVPIDSSVSPDVALDTKGVVFSDLHLVSEYCNNAKQESILASNGWLSAEFNDPDQFQRVICAPAGMEYKEQAYFMEGNYIKEGYRKVLNKQIAYWKPI